MLSQFSNAQHLNSNFFWLNTLCVRVRAVPLSLRSLFILPLPLCSPTFSVAHSMTFILKERNFFSSALGFFSVFHQVTCMNSNIAGIIKLCVQRTHFFVKTWDINQRFVRSAWMLFHRAECEWQNCRCFKCDHKKATLLCRFAMRQTFSN